MPPDNSSNEGLDNVPVAGGRINPVNTTGFPNSKPKLLFTKSLYCIKICLMFFAFEI